MRKGLPVLASRTVSKIRPTSHDAQRRLRTKMVWRVDGGGFSDSLLEGFSVMMGSEAPGSLSDGNVVLDMAVTIGMCVAKATW
jgi:hypothetical protein